MPNVEQVNGKLILERILQTRRYHTARGEMPEILHISQSCEYSLIEYLNTDYNRLQSPYERLTNLYGMVVIKDYLLTSFFKVVCKRTREWEQSDQELVRVMRKLSNAIEHDRTEEHRTYNNK